MGGSARATPGVLRDLWGLVSGVVAPKSLTLSLPPPCLPVGRRPRSLLCPSLDRWQGTSTGGSSPGIHREETGWDQVTPFARGARRTVRRFGAPFVTHPSSRGCSPTRRGRRLRDHTLFLPCAVFDRRLSGHSALHPRRRPHCLGLAAWPALTRVVTASLRQLNSEGLSRSVALRSVDCWPLANDLTRLSGVGLPRHPSTLSTWSGRGILLLGCAYRSSVAAFTGRAFLRRGPHPGKLSGGNWMVPGVAPLLERSVWDRAWTRPRPNLQLTSVLFGGLGRRRLSLGAASASR